MISLVRMVILYPLVRKSVFISNSFTVQIRRDDYLLYYYFILYQFIIYLGQYFAILHTELRDFSPLTHVQTKGARQIIRVACEFSKSIKNGPEY